MEKTTQNIFNWIAANPDHTEAEIAKGVGLKRTPYTRRILLWLWQEGYVVRYLNTDVMPGRYKYFVQETPRMEGLQ